MTQSYSRQICILRDSIDEWWCVVQVDVVVSSKLREDRNMPAIYSVAPSGLSAAEGTHYMQPETKPPWYDKYACSSPRCWMQAVQCRTRLGNVCWSLKMLITKYLVESWTCWADLESGSVDIACNIFYVRVLICVHLSILRLINHQSVTMILICR